MKRFIAMLKIQNGEYEYLKDVLITAKTLKAAYKIATETAKGWYGDDDVEQQDSWYYQNGGEVAVAVSSVNEIPKQDYDILKKYISESAGFFKMVAR